MNIEVVHQPGKAQLESLGVFKWPVWEKEPSTFPWTYHEAETCYILQGKAVITPEGGPPVEIGVGDLVIFGSDLRCMWHIVDPIRKHYRV
jgi:uncharacterized cupin superfamily protein